MASVQARILNLILRSAFKPRMQRVFQGNPPITKELREQLDGMMSWQPKLSSHVVIKPWIAKRLRGEWVNFLDSRPNRVILFLHGGGYVMGSPEKHRDFAWRLSEASGAKVLVVDYRLAPEHRFPAALEDALAAWRWLLAQGFRPEDMIISGDSAGGGLALATLLSLRDSDEPLPAAAILLSPWTDLTLSGESITFNAQADPFLVSGILPFIAENYVDENTDRRHPLVSPLFADLTGLPPFCLHVGGTEILLSDSTRLAEKAEAAGVPVSFKVWRNMPHVFHLCGCCLPEGRGVIEECGAFARSYLGKG